MQCGLVVLTAVGGKNMLKNELNQLSPLGTPKYRHFLEEIQKRKRLYSVKTKSNGISSGGFVYIGVVYLTGEFSGRTRLNKYSLKL